MDQADKIDATTAKLLYTGLLTDTGNFRHGPVTQRVHQIGGALVAAGADPLELTNCCITPSAQSIALFRALPQPMRMKTLPELNTVPILPFHKPTSNDYDIQTGDTEGLVNYTLSIKDTRLGVLMIEYPDTTKLSFRSIGDVPANAMAVILAAGGISTPPAQEVPKIFRKQKQNSLICYRTRPNCANPAGANGW